MHHMPRPNGTPTDRIEVPLVEYITYDFLGYSSFPKRNGFDIYDSQQGTIEPARLVTIVQSWLFFALISEVTGEIIALEDFTKVSTGQSTSGKFVDSTRLPLLLDLWQSKLRRLSVRDCDKILNHVRQVLDTAIDASLHVDNFDVDQPDDLAAISLSVKVLIATLIHFYNALNPEHQISCQDRRMAPAISTSQPPSAACQLIMERMRRRGWCPQSIRRVSCVASNIDESTYQPAHISADCQCQCIAVDVDQLVGIIDEGHIPLVRIKTHDFGDVEIELRESSDRQTFTAISHVWSDGLGNRETNGLPVCRLQQLQSSVQLTGHATTFGWFWIDTLCVPAGETYRHIKRKAISSMASIYQDAVAVVVLDDEIQSVCASDTATDFLAYILCSIWNGRFWTHQEAVLGKRLFFKTADGVELAPIADVAFFPGLDDGHSGLRWLAWRLFRGPLGVFIKFGSGACRTLPPTQAFSLGFKLACGPQAWQICFGGSTGPLATTSSVLHRLREATRGFLLICVAIAFTILSLPATIFGIALTYVGIAAFLIIWCIMLSAMGSEKLPADIILKQGMRIQLASDLVGEMQPKRVSPSIEALDPITGARMHKQRFVHAWNAMAERTATKFEDLHVILASLTGIIPYRITALSTPVVRMRAIASAYKTLPLELLFNRSLASTTSRDPLNTWLPLAPVGDLLSKDFDEPSIHVQEDTGAVIYLRELGQSFMAIMGPGYPSTSNSPLYYDPMSRTVWELEDVYNTSVSHRARENEICFLVYVSPFRRRGDNGNTQTLRAAKFLVHRRYRDGLHCQYDKLLTFKASKADATSFSGNMIRISDDMTISMDFAREELEDVEYRQAPGYYEYFIMLATMLCWYFMGTVVMLGIAASQTTIRVFYIGYPMVVLIAILFGIFAGPFFVRLGRSKQDGNLSTFADTWRVRLINAWLAMVAVNFAHREGRPKRWYHYTSSDLPMGKFSY